jgi:hypothetical protein
MTRIEINEGRLKVEVLGWDKLWSFKSRLCVPLGHVVGARRREKEVNFNWRGIRAPGTCLPGVIVAGTYHSKGEHIFYDVHDFGSAIVIELKDEWYARLVVEVPDPDAALQLLSGVAAQ